MVSAALSTANLPFFELYKTETHPNFIQFSCTRQSYTTLQRHYAKRNDVTTYTIRISSFEQISLTGSANRVTHRSEHLWHVHLDLSKIEEDLKSCQKVHLTGLKLSRFVNLLKLWDYELLALSIDWSMAHRLWATMGNWNNHEQYSACFQKNFWDCHTLLFIKSNVGFMDIIQ